MYCAETAQYILALKVMDCNQLEWAAFSNCVRIWRWLVRRGNPKMFLAHRKVLQYVQHDSKKIELHNIETNGSDWVVRQCCKVATGQKELDGQCVRRVALTIEYDSIIPDTQNTIPVAGETEKESPHVEQGVWVYHHRRTGPPNHEYLLESKPLPQGSILGKEFQLWWRCLLLEVQSAFK